MSSSNLIQDLKSLTDVEVLDSQEELLAASEDFGRLVHRTPRAVACPKTAEAAGRILDYANRNSIPVSTRGEAHSQSGQSLVQDGIVLSTRHLNAIEARQEDRVWVGAGALWGEVIKALDQEGWVPRVLTNNPGVTVGGTLSVAGIGISSHRYGAQGDNVDELEVVTPTGGLVRCSETENKELFDLVRSGLGQFGVIVRARLKLRQRLPKNRTWMLLYDSLESVLKDSHTLMKEDRVDYLESWCVPLPMGFRAVEGQKRAFGEWFFPLHLTQEFSPDSPPNEAALLEGLKPYRKSHVEDRTALEFAYRLDPLFELWKRMPYWGSTHPWMEVILPWESAPFYVNSVLSRIPPPMLGGGHILLWPSSGTTSKAPLFKRPQGEFVLGFGILPGLPRQFVDPVLEALDMASNASMMFGGKRYLSGWIRFNKDNWKQHFDTSWASICEAKKKYDPKGLLNPGFIEFD